MIIERHTSFKKSYNRRIASHPSLVKRVDERIILFIKNPTNVLLRDHALRGEQLGLRSFSVSGDIRIIYEPVGSDCVRFLDIGSHNQVY